MRKLQAVLSIVLLTASAISAILPGALASGYPLTPDNDNSADAATPITSGVVTAGEVDRSGNDRYDYFKINANAGQTINASVKYDNSQADVRVDVQTYGGQSILVQSEVSGGGTLRGDTGLAPNNGTFYIRINCNANNQASFYNLTVTVADPPMLVPGVQVSGYVASPESRTDWYRMWLDGSSGGQAQGGWVDMTKTDSSASIYKSFVDLLNYNGTHIYNASTWNNALTNLSGLASYTGWYYYRIYASSWQGSTTSSGYTLSNGRFQMAADSDNDFMNATAAAKNARLTGAVDKAFDHYDWYSHKVLTNDNIIVNVSRTSSGAWFNVAVFNSKMELVISDDSTGGYGSSNFLNQTVPAAPIDDTYYIAVIMVGISGYGGYLADDPAQMSYWINFSSPNHPPQIKNQFSPITIDEDVHYKMNIYDYFSDPDGDSLKVKVTAPHVQASYCQTTGELQLFGAPNWYGNENAQVIAQDAQFQTAAIVNVTVLPVEDSPYLMKPIPAVAMDQAKSYGPMDLSAFFFDNDTLYPPGDKLTFGVFANGSVWVNITAAGKVTLSAPINFWGTVNMTFSATDKAGNIATGVCMVVVRHVNQPPQVRNQPPEMQVNEDETLVFDFSPVFWDPDGDPITLTPSQNMNIDVLVDPGDLNISFRPKPDMGGFFENIVLTAKDSSGLGSNSVVVKVTVVPVNDPPRITAFSPPGNVTLTEGDTLDFSVAAQVPESLSAVNFAWYLDGLKVLSGATTFVFKTNHSSAGDHIVKVSVDDGELSTSMEWNVTVKNLNREPTKVAIVTPHPGDLLKEGVSVKFEGSATDPDEDPLSYRWMEGLVELGTGRTLYLSLSIGIHKINLEVSDGAVTVKSPVVSVTVKANSKPNIISFSPADGKKFEEGKTVTFSAEAMDADNDPLSYCWTEGGRTLSTNSSFAMSSLSTGKHRIMLTVSDGLAVVENTVTIEVVEPKAGGTDLTLMLGVVAVVAIVAVVAAVLLIRRGRRARPAEATFKQPELQW